MAALVCGAGTARGQGERLPDAAPNAGPAYPVRSFVIRYLHEDHPQHPRLRRLERLEVTLGRTATGFVAPRDDTPTIEWRLDMRDETPAHFHASALQVVLARIHAYLSEQGLIGVFVAPDPEDLTQRGEDLRPADRPDLRILVTTSLVASVRTLSRGRRAEDLAEVNDPAHARIVDRSTVAPWPGGAALRRDLLLGSALNDYVIELSRHPGRRVDAALEPGDEVGAVTLDYLVYEQRPWHVYAQVSNTGTPSTDRIRERFGFYHSQLTNNDDILAIDYVTAAFDDVNAVALSYDTPTPFGERVRFRAHAAYSEYTATELGVFADIFDGESWSIGGEFVANLFQSEGFFVDVSAGFRRDRVETENRVLLVGGEESFNIASFGLRLERRTVASRVIASLAAEWNDGQDPSPDPNNLNLLGRVFADTDFGVLRWDVRAEVWLDGMRAGVGDEAPPPALAHEVVASVRGQYAFDNRLIPQFQHVAGGLHTVRGYPESIVAGDSVVIGSLEYRFHVPRAFAVEPEPRTLFGDPFRFAPTRPGGATDWDLILRAFVDVGRTEVNDALSFERDETLIGAGVGLDIRIHRDIDLRADWGFAIEGLESRDVNSGSNRFHFAATIFF